MPINTHSDSPISARRRIHPGTAPRPVLQVFLFRCVACNHSADQRLPPDSSSRYNHGIKKYDHHNYHHISSLEENSCNSPAKLLVKSDNPLNLSLSIT